MSYQDVLKMAGCEGIDATGHKGRLIWAGSVIRSAGVAKMMAVTVEVRKGFALAMLDNKTETMCKPARGEQPGNGRD